MGAHPLGTDKVGRDYFSRLLFGARISLGIGVGVALVSTMLGAAIGIAAGYWGGKVDMVASFLIQARLAMPVILIALAAIAVLDGSLGTMVVVLSLLLWDRAAVMTRSATQQLRSRAFVRAARALGCSDLRIIVAEIFPNLLNGLVVIATIELGNAVLLEAGLSFLGLGIRPPAPSWGLMLADAGGYFLRSLGNHHSRRRAVPAGAGDQRAGQRAAGSARRCAMTALLAVEELHVRIGAVHAVRGISFAVERGETLSIVGESGCGKTMTALAVMGLLPAGAQRSAQRLGFDGVDLLRVAEPALADIRGNRIAMVFQDPMTTLNPVYTVGDQLEEAWLCHRGGSRAAARARAVALLERVGISDPQDRLGAYPHQLSGGIAQRVVIAMALMCSPALLLADEPRRRST